MESTPLGWTPMESTPLGWTPMESMWNPSWVDINGIHVEPLLGGHQWIYPSWVDTNGIHVEPLLGGHQWIYPSWVDINGIYVEPLLGGHQWNPCGTPLGWTPMDLPLLGGHQWNLNSPYVPRWNNLVSSITIFLLYIYRRISHLLYLNFYVNL